MDSYGELQGLATGWQLDFPRTQKATVGTKSGKYRGETGTKSTRGKLYCQLKCDGHILRTSVTSGTVRPTWNEELSFKSVQAWSDLQVSLLTTFSYFQA